MNLFEEDKPISNFLHVLHNGKKINFEFDKIFDANLFDTVSIATYVSSLSFFLKKTKNFKYINLILGIEDNTVLLPFWFDPQAKNDFFKDINNLDNELIDKIIPRLGTEIKIFFTNLGTAIHSKIYLLENSLNPDTHVRVAIGSANFTDTAFSNKRQFEELLIFDSNYDKNITDAYKARFKEILDNAIDYIPERYKKIKNHEELKLQILNVCEDTYVDTIKENISKFNSSIFYVNGDLAKDLGLLENQEKELEKEIETVKTTNEIIKVVTKQSKGKTVFISPIEIEKKKESIIAKINTIKAVKKDFEDNRINILYNASVMSLVDETNNPYSFELSETDIKRKMKIFDKFIASYTNYTIHNESRAGISYFSTPAKIFEALLYAFTSHYIWKLRIEYSKNEDSEEIKRYMPIFMVIAGQTNTGKTQLLKFMSHATGNFGNYYKFTLSSKMYSTTDINAQAIYQLLQTQNVTPIFVDEITKDYFSSASSNQAAYKGETFIKTTTNNKTGVYPCLISTCNTDFTADPQVMNRIKYIHLNNPFIETKREEMLKYFNDIVAEFGNELHKDFCFRFENIFKLGIDKFDYEDFLAIGRAIFKNYINISFTEIPVWYNEKKINDYYTRGKYIWRAYYIQKPNAFKVISNEILVDDAILFGNDMSSSTKRKESIQYLPHSVILETKGVLKLDKNSFMNFIQDNNGESGNNNIIKRVLNLFRM